MMTATELLQENTLQKNLAKRFAQLRVRITYFLWSRRIRPLPTFAAFAMLAVLFALGTWQVLRMEEKNNLLSAARQQISQPPADLRRDWPGKDGGQSGAAWEEYHYRPVMLDGEFLDHRRFKLAPRTYEGQAGYHLIVPFQLEDGQIVFINRGFVPDGDEILPQAGRTDIFAVARVMEREKPWGGIENDSGKNRWVWADIAAMGRETGFSRIAPVMLYELRDPARDNYPIGGQIPLPRSNPHWHYAVTWYAMALILIGVYVMSLSPDPEKNRMDNTKQNATTDEDLSDPVARRGRYPEATD